MSTSRKQARFVLDNADLSSSTPSTSAAESITYSVNLNASTSSAVSQPQVQQQRISAGASMTLLDDPNDSGAVGSSGGQVLTDQERFLPIANVARIMKRMVPEPGKVAKETKECAQEVLSEFIHFIASEAAERSALEKRKTINGEDILNALQTLGFDNFVDPLKTYLVKYRDAMRGEQNEPTAAMKGNKQVMITEAELEASLLQAGGSAGGAQTITLQGPDGKPLDASNQNVIYMDPQTNKNYIMVSGPNSHVQLIEVQTVLQQD